MSLQTVTLLCRLGKPDLAVTNYNAGVSVLLNNGDGTFASVASYPAGATPRSVLRHASPCS
jgi:hypothetical protein